MIPAPPVISILAAVKAIPDNELPKPTRAPVPAKPPAMVVNVIGRLDA